MFDKELDIQMPPPRAKPASPTLGGFYRTMGIPAFWDGARAVREQEPFPGGAVRRIDFLRRTAEAGEPMADVPELREWQAHGR